VPVGRINVDFPFIESIRNPPVPEFLLIWKNWMVGWRIGENWLILEAREGKLPRLPRGSLKSDLSF